MTQLTQAEVSAMNAIAKDSRIGGLLVLVLGPIIFPILIPLATGLVWWRLFQWYWLAMRKPALVRADPSSLIFHDSEDDPRLRASLTELISNYRVARIPLWFGALFWPIVAGLVVWYFSLII